MLVRRNLAVIDLCGYARSPALFAALKVEYEKLHKAVLAIVRKDAVCRRLMTVPSVGPLVAITYKSAMDDPHRIAKSKAVGALFGRHWRDHAGRR